MSKETLLKRLKIELGLIKFADFPMLEGDAVIRVEADMLEVGQAAMLVAADGTESAAPEGTHQLADGSSITVDAAGLITEVKAAEEEVETEIEIEMKPITDAQLSKIKEAFATGTPEERLANLEILSKALMEYAFGWELREQESKAIRETAIGVYKTAMSSLKADFNATATKLSKVEKMVLELSEEPAAKPIKAGSKVSKEMAKDEVVDMTKLSAQQRIDYKLYGTFKN